MKSLHRADLFSWTRFDEARDIDFHGYAIVRGDGNVLVDPLAMSDHDVAHLSRLGGARTIVVTNSDHVRASVELAERFGATVCGPAAEREGFPCKCDRWLRDGDVVVPGLSVVALEGSKTPGELALVLDGSTLITGDLVRAQRAGSLNLLPDAKLSDRSTAVASVARLAALEGIEAVLVGDGWSIFRDGGRALRELLSGLGASAS